MEGVDYWKTLSLVESFYSICINPAPVAFFDLHVHLINAVTAFLYEKLQEEVSLEHPEGFTRDDKRILVCHLTNAMYDLSRLFVNETKSSIIIFLTMWRCSETVRAHAFT